ncbi:DnaJ domain-containing protein [Methylobacterium nigriterrae]|uniref:DnaJ domain-containing protein n=1 Tax=Methylobacterium nigriterrae TaxID=3127512 RepID=UPI0030136FC1
MTLSEACEVLGVRPGATYEEIKSAYREPAKRCHPDLNGEGPRNSERFQRVQDAYQTLRRWGGIGRGDQARGRTDNGATEEDRLDPVRVVRTFMAENDVEVLLDGSMRRRSDSRMARTQADVEACLSMDEIDAPWLVDGILLDPRWRECGLRKPAVERALRRVVREDQKRRRVLILRPLFSEVTPSERARAEEEWLRLASAAFETDATLAAAVLGHFIWQVKQKTLRRPVEHHLAPVVFGPEQGSGKTTFVRHFLGPLQELAIGPLPLSDVADTRSGDIYRYPVLFLDDIERVDPRRVPVLKSLVTSERIRRRRLGTSYSTTILQRTTLIGTANTPIDELVADETGNRRFATLRFRNGEAAKRGDRSVWDIVNETNYELLWRSVEALAPSPMEAHLDGLFALQAASRRQSELAAWLADLDVGSDAVRRITSNWGVGAQALWELFRAQTGSTMSLTRFGMEMTRLVADPAVPFGSKTRNMHGTFYPLKAGGA